MSNDTKPMLCCAGGPMMHDRVWRSEVSMLPFGTEAALMVIFMGLLLVGGILNNWSPAPIRPKGFLGPLFYQRLGTSMYLRYTPVELLAVLLVLGFYVARFVAFYNLYLPSELALEADFQHSNGAARAVAAALEEVYYPMLPMQVSLAVKNMFWIMLGGLPVERAIAYHNWHGYLMTLVYITIWICYAIGRLTTRQFLSPFCLCDNNPLAGLLGLIFQCLITLTALPIVRRKYWEYFYLMGHWQLLFPLIWAVLFNNRIAAFPWIALSTAQWGMSDLSLRIFMKVFQHTKVLSVEAKGDVTILTCTKQYDGNSQTLGLLTSKWEAGSYVWLACRMEGSNPLKGKAPPPFNQHWACYHPISISSPPIEADGSPAKAFTMHIKSFGPGTWSHALLTKARLGENPSTWKVWVGGPNGKLSINPFHCDKILLCAGGIGCTPLLALATDLHYRGLNKGGPAPPKVDYIHIERDLNSFESVYAPQLKLFKASHVVTPKLYCSGLVKGEMTEGGSSKACGIEVRAGRPDFTDLLVQSKTESDRPTVKALDGGFQVIGVYACGPKPMMKSVREAVQRASGGGVKFYLHEETYEL